MIISLITLYYPTKETVSNVRSVSSQSDVVYLCDNSPSDNASLFVGIGNARYTYFGKNLGLSGAFNHYLKTQNFSDTDFIFFFDQDSNITDDHIKKLVSEYELLEQADIQIGCLGPVYFNTSSNQVEIPKRKIRLNEHSYKVSSIITSSMLVKYKTLKEIDFWNEGIFLDMADWDLCWRLIASGKLCCMTDAVTLHHTLGKGEKKIGFLRIKEGSSFRVYYQTRDCLRLITKSYAPFKYKIRFFLMLSIRPVAHVIFLGNKKERIKYFIKGIRDFSKGIYGSL